MRYLLPFFLACSGTKRYSPRKSNPRRPRWRWFNQEDDQWQRCSSRPNGTEICDGADNNCDGEIMKAYKTFMQTPMATVLAIRKWYRYLRGSQWFCWKWFDCDDTSANSYPGAGGLRWTRQRLRQRNWRRYRAFFSSTKMVMGLGMIPSRL